VRGFSQSAMTCGWVSMVVVMVMVMVVMVIVRLGQGWDFGVGGLRRVATRGQGVRMRVGLALGGAEECTLAAGTTDTRHGDASTLCSRPAHATRLVEPGGKEVAGGEDAAVGAQPVLLHHVFVVDLVEWVGGWVGGRVGGMGEGVTGYSW